MSDSHHRSGMSPQDVLKRVIAAARAFQERHSSDAAIGSTFSYFVSHPVSPLNRRRLRLLLEQVQKRSQELKRPLRVLDLACGGGLITGAVASLGHRALGIDLSADEIRLAQLFAQEAKLDGVFLQADLMKDPDWEKKTVEILGGKPDVVTLAYALHHLPEVENFVARLSRWLDPGALLLINEENPDSPLFRLKHAVRGVIQKDTDVEWHRTFTGWMQLLEQNHFHHRAPLLGADLLPLLARVKPAQCWSLVFSAEKS